MRRSGLRQGAQEPSQAACGGTPRKVLTASGVVPHECSGVLETALAQVYDAGYPALLKSRRKGLGKACGGEGCG